MFLDNVVTTSANSVTKPIGAETPTDALGVDPSMSTSNGDTQESDASEPKYRDEEWLREQYKDKKRSTYEIAEECGCWPSTVSKWLKRYGVETRGQNRKTPDQLKKKAWLRKQYLDKEQTQAEIAEQCGCAPPTVSQWLTRHNIKTRSKGARVSDNRLENESWLHTQYVVKKRSPGEIAQECECSLTTVNRWLDLHGLDKNNGSDTATEGLKNEEWLREQYIDKEKTQKEIGQKCDRSKTAVCIAMRKHGIKAREQNKPGFAKLESESWLREQYVEKNQSVREISEAYNCDVQTVIIHLRKHGIQARDMMGENNPHWSGGSYAYGPGWNKNKRCQVRERDGHKCLDCGMTQTEHKEKYGQKLHVHHLRKARDVDDPEKRNALENLATLCRDCHRRWERIASTGLYPDHPSIKAD